MKLDLTRQQSIRVALPTREFEFGILCRRLVQRKVLFMIRNRLTWVAAFVGIAVTRGFASRGRRWWNEREPNMEAPPIQPSS